MSHRKLQQQQNAFLSLRSHKNVLADGANQNLMKLISDEFQKIAPLMSPEEAIYLLQRHERARQGRLRAKVRRQAHCRPIGEPLT